MNVTLGEIGRGRQANLSLRMNRGVQGTNEAPAAVRLLRQLLLLLPLNELQRRFCSSVAVLLVPYPVQGPAIPCLKCPPRPLQPSQYPESLQYLVFLPFDRQQFQRSPANSPPTNVFLSQLPVCLAFSRAAKHTASSTGG